MNRRSFVGSIAIQTLFLGTASHLDGQSGSAASAAWDPKAFKESATGKDWLERWSKRINSDSRNRYCDKEMGEELGWMASPFLNGFYYGYLATHDTSWIDRLCDWADSCIKRSLQEPDGFPGWPKGDGGGGDSSIYTADSLLGEAMMLRPIVLMAGVILQDPALKTKYGEKAQSYITLAEQVFTKWDSRDCWREVKEGGVWVVASFGIDKKTGGWSAGYADRKKSGFTNPDNKQNHIAKWMIAMHDVTQKPIYLERAEKWFRVMKSRMKTREGGKYYVWDYWEPAGPWDYKPNGATKHWVGVHPNGGYYHIDAESIVCAFAHGIVFTKPEIDRLIATNRDFMWDKNVEEAKFQRINGEEPDPRWKDSPGVLWEALAAYDPTLRAVFVANHNPAGWGGLSITPWFLAGADPRG